MQLPQRFNHCLKDGGKLIGSDGPEILSQVFMRLF
jgi:hypothetical protein